MRVWIEAADPFGSSRGDLARALASVHPELEVEDETPLFSWHGPVPVTEVVMIYIGFKAVDAATRKVAEGVIDAAVGWAQKGRAKGERRKRVKIYGPDNEILRNVLVSEEGEHE